MHTRPARKYDISTCRPTQLSSWGHCFGSLLKTAYSPLPSQTYSCLLHNVTHTVWHSVVLDYINADVAAESHCTVCTRSALRPACQITTSLLSKATAACCRHSRGLVVVVVVVAHLDIIPQLGCSDRLQKASV